MLELAPATSEVGGPPPGGYGFRDRKWARRTAEAQCLYFLSLRQLSGFGLSDIKFVIGNGLRWSPSRRKRTDCT